MPNIIIFGTSRVADIVYTYLKDVPDYQIVAFTVDREYLTEENKFGIPIIAFEEIEKHFPPLDNEMIVAIGYHEMNGVRETKCNRARAIGYKLRSFIDKKASIASNV